MSNQMILTEQRGRVGIATMNRPETLNAMHPVMLGELYGQVQAWGKDKSVGAIVVTGAGKGFCAGADVSGWARNTGPAPTNGLPSATKTGSRSPPSRNPSSRPSTAPQLAGG